MSKSQVQTERNIYSSINPFRKRVAISFIDENGEPVFSPVEQSHKNLCDIDKIIAQYDKTGLITHTQTALAHYGDFTQVNEYQESLNLVNDAQRAFDELPALIRAEFNNDPGFFMEYVTNPKNEARLMELGLVNKPVEKTPKIKSEEPSHQLSEKTPQKAPESP